MFIVVVYTLLYYTGLRINEIRQITHKRILDAIASYQPNAIHYKTNRAHIHILSRNGVKKLSLEYTIIFNKYGYKYLFGKSKPIHQKFFTRFMNNNLKNTCQVFGIPYNVKSRRFRINMISNLIR